MTPEQVRIRLGLKPFDAFYTEQSDATWFRCRKESGFDRRVNEHERKYGNKLGLCQKCQLAKGSAKRHARKCVRRGWGQLYRKHYVVAQGMHRKWESDPRHTGRTTNALITIIAAAAEGGTCLYITHSPAFQRLCMKKINDFLLKLGLESAQSRINVASADMQVRGCTYDNVMLDHCVYDFPKMADKALAMSRYLKKTDN